MDHAPRLTSYKSRVNQPDRVFISSNDDAIQSTGTGFNLVRATFDTPILDAKRTQLLRATIPNATVNIPDYQTVFWYYQLPAATTVPSATYLKAVRLYPSQYVPPTSFTAYTLNRTFTDPSDLVVALNAAAAAGGDNVTYNPYWVSGDVSFAYNTTTRRITFTGLTSAKFYANAGWNDPVVTAAIASGLMLVNSYGAAGAGAGAIQPLVAGYTLNLRCGYAMSGQALATQGNNAAAQGAYANLTNYTRAQNVAVPSDSFPNLVYTQCVYIYADITSGSGLGSGKQHNLLAVVPNNAAPLGVIQYVAATLTWLTKVPSNIYEILLDIRDDANQPLPLPDNAQVNVELAFSYHDM
jgi:hypothetical protein